MIVGNDFVLVHVGKTGGDAAKQITGALNLDGLKIYSTSDPLKHASPYLIEAQKMKGKDLIVPLRRLPARELSYLHHHRLVRRSGKFPSDFRGFTLTHGTADVELKNCTIKRDGTLGKPAGFIRCEHLINDLLNLYRAYGYTITDEVEHRARRVQTKRRQRYDHNLKRWYSTRDMRAIYNANPLWTKLENEAYGGTFE